MEDMNQIIDHLASEAASRLYAKLEASYTMLSFGSVRARTSEVLYEKDLKRLDFEISVTARDKALLTANEFVEKFIEPSVANIAKRINSLEGNYHFLKITLDDNCIWSGMEDEGVYATVVYGYNMKQMQSFIGVSVTLIKSEDVV